MCHKILLVALLMCSLVSEIVSATNRATNGSVEACHDNWTLSKCKRKELRGRCERKRTAKNCQKTCGFCTASDICTPYDYTPYKGCGLVPASSRIVGGDDASPHSIPWQVGILNGLESISCGGTLLTEKHVLSAAHCNFFDNGDVIPASDIVVVVAEHHQYNLSDGIKHEITSYTNHPQYNLKPDDYDFSMLHLTLPVEFGDRAVPACLPDLRFSDDKLVGKYLTVSGWGSLDGLGYEYPKVLQTVDVPVVSQDDCRKAYLPFGRKVENSMICAGYSTGGKDSCDGDSGGPLTYKENGRSYLIGVVSWGHPKCALPEYPGVYARVTTALDWIQEELGKSC